MYKQQSDKDTRYVFRTLIWCPEISEFLLFIRLAFLGNGRLQEVSERILPFRWISEFQVEFTPTSIHKFDTHIQVNVRGWKTISLRVGGTIEPPCVDIDMVCKATLLLINL